MDKILKPVCLMVILALVLSLGVALAPSPAMANELEQFCTVDKVVTPTEIWQKGSGMGLETAAVILSVTGGSAAASADFWVYDALPNYINLEGAFSKAPDTTVEAYGLYMWGWHVGSLQPGQTWAVSFNISSDECGRLLVDEPGLSYAWYRADGDGYGDGVRYGVERFPEVYIDVLCPEAEPARIIVRNLLIEPVNALPGQQVVISADVVNQGGVRGSKDIELAINGEAEQSIRVGVDPGAAQHITFYTSKTVPGTYEVYIEGQASAFNVLLRPHVTSEGTAGGLSTAAIITIVVIAVIFLAGMIFVFIRVRR